MSNPAGKEIKPTFSQEKSAEREKLYDTMYPRPDEKPGATDPKGPIVEKPAEPPAAPVVKEAPKVDEPIAPAPEPVRPGKEEEKKTVPLEALHEARKDLQDVKKENSELKEQVKVLLTDLRELHKAPKVEEEPVLNETDYDKTLKALQAEVKELREREKQRDTLSEADKVRQAREKLTSDIDSANAALEAEGYHGFRDLLPLVEAELRRIHTVKPEDAAALDNKAGWMKIFKETIFTRVNGVVQKKAKDEKNAGKEALKEGSALLLNGGEPPANPKKDDKDEWTFDSYIEQRKRNSPQTQMGR